MAACYVCNRPIVHDRPLDPADPGRCDSCVTDERYAEIVAQRADELGDDPGGPIC